jgi:hypothetical protein
MKYGYLKGWDPVITLLFRELQVPQAQSYLSQLALPSGLRSQQNLLSEEIWAP